MALILFLYKILVSRPTSFKYNFIKFLELDWINGNFGSLIALVFKTIPEENK